MLTLDNGDQFASGVMDYVLEPLEDPKLTVEVEISGIQTAAVVDTGTPFLVCSLQLATRIDLSRFSKLGSRAIATRLGTIHSARFIDFPSSSSLRKEITFRLKLPLSSPI